MKHWLKLILLLSCPLWATESPFSPVVPGRIFEFPRDHNLHRKFQSEWWYVTANLKDDQGNDYGVQFTLFSNAPTVAGKPRRLYFAHAALSTDTQFFYAERYAREDMHHGGQQAKPWRAYLDHWQYKGTDDKPLPGTIDVQEDDFGYHLSLSESRYFLLGDQGFSRKNPSGSIASYYYNAPFIKVRGTLNIKGKAVTVSGHAWLDREFSSGIFAGGRGNIDKIGWHWLAVHPDEHTALMLYQVFRPKENYLDGMVIYDDGRQVPLSAKQITWQPTEYQTFGNKRYPIRWQLKIPAVKLNVDIVPINNNQWLGVSIPYWEGAVKIQGSHNGDGYLELF